jgi:hypothetical protein
MAWMRGGSGNGAAMNTETPPETPAARIGENTTGTLTPDAQVGEDGTSEPNHSLPSALRAEADFLSRRFKRYADDLLVAAGELEELRHEIAYLRAGVLHAIENEHDRLDILNELHNSERSRNNEGLIG